MGPSQVVSARVVEYTPARAQSLDEVKARVRELVVAQAASALARKEGEEKLAAWKANPAAAAAALAASVVVARDQNQKQPAQVVDAALRVRPACLPAWWVWILVPRAMQW